MGREKGVYVVCARLPGATAPLAEAHDAAAGQPASRRMNRMERVALAYGGRLVRRASGMLLTSFATANAAALAACEMQRRCHGMPRLASYPVPLHVGIHRAAPPGTSPADPGERRDGNRRFGFTMAQLLADAADRDCVLVSGLVFRALAPDLRERCRPLAKPPLGIPAFGIDWSGTLSLQPQVSIHAAPTSPSRRHVVLRKNASRLVLDQLDVATTFGRDPACDVAVADHLVSREHAHIELHPDGCLLTDHSTNGTSVVFHSGHEVLLHNESFLLEGRGRISLGRSADSNAAGVIEFRVLKV